MFMCTCLHMYMSVLEERNSAIMRMRNFNIPYIEYSYKEKLTNGGKMALSVGDISQYTLYLSSLWQGKGEEFWDLLSDNTSISQMNSCYYIFVCFIQSRS